MSNLKYVETLPEGWVISSIGENCLVKNGYAFRSEDYVAQGILNFRVVNITSDGSLDISNSFEYLPDSFAEEYSDYLLKEGDILLVMVGATRGKVGFVTINVLPALMNQNMWRIVPKDDGVDNKYLFFFLKEHIHLFMKQYSENARGFFKKDEFRDIKLPLPSIQEQHNIAHILSKIQSAIETQEKIIQTTTELKRALMKQLFTKGVNNNDFKDTELGSIPKSWQVVKAEDFCDRVTDGTHDTPKPSQEGHYLITSKNLKGRYIGFEDSYFISQNDYDLVNQRSKVDLYDVLFGMIGTIGSPVLITTEPDFAIKNVGLFKTGKDKNKGLWLYHYLCSPVVQELINKQSKGAIQKYVPLWWLRSLPIFLPPENERMVIIRSLETIDNKLESAETKKSTLQLLFRSMLHHLMTGQIRVKDIRFS